MNPAGSFLLAHHYPEDYGRTYVGFGVRLCARCLGLYPALGLAVALQIALRPPPWPFWDAVWVALGTLPGWVDWAKGRFDPASGSNLLRTATGVLLGVALGRTVYLNMVNPANALSVAHFLALALSAGVVELASRPARLLKRLERTGEPMP